MVSAVLPVMVSAVVGQVVSVVGSAVVSLVAAVVAAPVVPVVMNLFISSMNIIMVEKQKIGNVKLFFPP